jgi:hypothetical protein
MKAASQAEAVDGTWALYALIKCGLNWAMSALRRLVEPGTQIASWPGSPRVLGGTYNLATWKTGQKDLAARPAMRIASQPDKPAA